MNRGVNNWELSVLRSISVAKQSAQVHHNMTFYSGTYPLYNF